MSWGFVPLKDIAPSKPLKHPQVSDSQKIWLLNLDKVESHSGTVIQKVRGDINIAGSSTHWFDDSHVLYSKLRPYLNKVVLPDEEGLATTEFVPLMPDKGRLDRRYLAYYLRSQNFVNWVTEKIAGAKMPRVSMDVFWKHEIPVPFIDNHRKSLEEQKRIAAILDKADVIRRKRQQAIQLADDLLRSVFLDMFGDPVSNPKGFPDSKLGTNCDDLFLGLTSKVDYVDGINGYPLIRAKDINKGELSFDEVKYISETQHRKLTKNHLTRKGDLLVSKSGTLGTCAIVRTEREFSTYESIFTVRPNVSKVNLHYLIHLLQNRGFKDKLIGNKVGGTVAHLNLKMFRDFEIGLPPIDIQNRFSVKIIKCEKKIEKYRQSAIEAKSFFNSISQKAFAGEL